MCWFGQAHRTIPNVDMVPYHTGLVSIPGSLLQPLLIKPPYILIANVSNTHLDQFYITSSNRKLLYPFLYTCSSLYNHTLDVS